jgi:hypothetical protein
MKSNHNSHNRGRMPSVPPKLVALASGLAIAALSSGAATADAHTQTRARAADTAAQQAAELKSLTRVVERLDHGGTAAVLKKPQQLANPDGGVVTAQALVFSANDGQRYLAYSPEAKPDFSGSPQAVAEKLAPTIITLQDSGDGPPAMLSAHLNAQHELVAGKHQTLVGYAMLGSQAPQS